MTTTDITTTSPSTAAPAEKRRDSARTKQQLLRAAKELFAERGYGSTTVRDIGEAAGVDPALIARYFGSKSALFVAVCETEAMPRSQVFDNAEIDRVVSRAERIGPTPVLRSVVNASDDELIVEAARRILDDHMVTPMRRRLQQAGSGSPELEAELLLAALAGIVLARSAGTFVTLATADHDEVMTLLRRLMAAFAD